MPLSFPSTRDDVGYAATPEQPSAGWEVVTLVGDQPLGALARPTPTEARYPDGIEESPKPGATVPLARREENREWPPPAIADEMYLGRQPTPASP
jgi:hypothetical protein